MTTSFKKTIVVVGATGNQGSSVAKTFLALPNWHVRCLTRSPNKESAIQLANQGAELVQANLSNPASLKSAFQGAHTIFLNTDFWETWRPAKAAADAKGKSWQVASTRAFEVETTNGKNAADAAAAISSLERLVVSTLTNVAKISDGKFNKSMHSQAKDWVVEYIGTKLPDLAKKTSYIYLGAYHDNALVVPRFDPNIGKHIIAVPFKGDKKIPVINAKESTGKFVRALIEDEEPDTKLLAYDTYPTMNEIVEQWSKENEKEAVLVPITIDILRDKSGLTDEHLDAFAAFAEHGYVEGVDGVIEPHELKQGGK